MKTHTHQKVVIVFGGSTGLGLAMLNEFRSASYIALPVGRRSEVIKTALGETKADPAQLVADVTSSSQIKRVFDYVLKEFGRIDCVVNSSGTHVKVPSQNMTDEQWDQVLNTNLRGAFYISREAHRTLTRPGSILHITSINGEVAFPDTLAYCTSKAAMNMLVKSLARDWAKDGIRVNAIAPGVIPTDLNRKALSDPDRLKKIVDKNPMGKLGLPEDVAGAALFLSSDAASYINGVILPVDGGFLANGL